MSEILVDATRILFCQVEQFYQGIWHLGFPKNSLVVYHTHVLVSLGFLPKTFLAIMK